MTRNENDRFDLTPRQIVEYLDRYIVGQEKAKKSVAIALRNRIRRRAFPRISPRKWRRRTFSWWGPRAWERQRSPDVSPIL